MDAGGRAATAQGVTVAQHAGGCSADGAPGVGWLPEQYVWDPHRLVAVPYQSETELLAGTQQLGTQPDSLVPPVLPGPAISGGKCAKTTCKVQGCQRLLFDEKPYYQRFLVCEEHMRSLSIQVNGQLSRFCQQCGKFEPVEAFDANKRSCRARLQEHNKRRRKTSTSRSLRRHRRQAAAVNKAAKAAKAAGLPTAAAAAAAAATAGRTDADSQQQQGPDTEADSSADGGGVTDLAALASGAVAAAAAGPADDSAAQASAAYATPAASLSIGDIIGGGTDSGLEQEEIGSKHTSGLLTQAALYESSLLFKQATIKAPQQQQQQHSADCSPAVGLSTAQQHMKHSSSCSSSSALAATHSMQALGLSGTPVSAAPAATAAPAAAAAAPAASGEEPSCAFTEEDRLLLDQLLLESADIIGEALQPELDAAAAASAAAAAAAAAAASLAQNGKRLRAAAALPWAPAFAPAAAPSLGLPSEQVQPDASSRLPPIMHRDDSAEDNRAFMTARDYDGGVDSGGSNGSKRLKPQFNGPARDSISRAQVAAEQQLAQQQWQFNQLQALQLQLQQQSFAASTGVQQQQQQPLLQTAGGSDLSSSSTMQAQAAANSSYAHLQPAGLAAAYGYPQQWPQQQLLVQQQAAAASGSFGMAPAASATMPAEYGSGYIAAGMHPALQQQQQSVYQATPAVDQQQQQQQRQAALAAALAVANGGGANAVYKPCDSSLRMSVKIQGADPSQLQPEMLPRLNALLGSSSSGVGGGYGGSSGSSYAYAAAAGPSFQVECGYMQPGCVHLVLQLRCAADVQEAAAALDAAARGLDVSSWAWALMQAGASAASNASNSTSGTHAASTGQHPDTQGPQDQQGPTGAAFSLSVQLGDVSVLVIKNGSPDPAGAAVLQQLLHASTLPAAAPPQLGPALLSSMQPQALQPPVLPVLQAVLPCCLSTRSSAVVDGRCRLLALGRGLLAAAGGAGAAQAAVQHGLLSAAVGAPAAAAAAGAAARPAAVLARCQGMFLPAEVSVPPAAHADTVRLLLQRARGASSSHGSEQPAHAAASENDGSGCVALTLQRLQPYGLVRIEVMQGLLLSQSCPLLVVDDDAVAAELQGLQAAILAGGQKQAEAQQLLVDFGRLLDFRAAAERHASSNSNRVSSSVAQARAAATEAAGQRGQHRRSSSRGHVSAAPDVAESSVAPAAAVGGSGAGCEAAGVHGSAHVGGSGSAAGSATASQQPLGASGSAAQRPPLAPSATTAAAAGAGAGASQGSSTATGGLFRRSPSSAPLPSGLRRLSLSLPWFSRRLDGSSRGGSGEASTARCFNLRRSFALEALQHERDISAEAEAAAAEDDGSNERIYCLSVPYSLFASGNSMSSSSASRRRSFAQDHNQDGAHSEPVSRASSATAGHSVVAPGVLPRPDAAAAAAAAPSRGRSAAAAASGVFSARRSFGDAVRRSRSFRAIKRSLTCGTLPENPENASEELQPQEERGLEAELQSLHSMFPAGAAEGFAARGAAPGQQRQQQQQQAAAGVADEQQEQLCSSEDEAEDGDSVSSILSVDESLAGTAAAQEHPLLSLEYKGVIMDVGVRLLCYLLDRGWTASARMVLQILLQHAAPVASFRSIAAAVAACGGQQLGILHRAARSGQLRTVVEVVSWGVAQRVCLAWDAKGPNGLTPAHLLALSGSGVTWDGRPAGDVPMQQRLAAAVLQSSPELCMLWFRVRDTSRQTPAQYASSLGCEGINKLAWCTLVREGSLSLYTSRARSQRNHTAVRLPRQVAAAPVGHVASTAAAPVAAAAAGSAALAAGADRPALLEQPEQQQQQQPSGTLSRPVAAHTAAGAGTSSSSRGSGCVGGCSTHAVQEPVAAASSSSSSSNRSTSGRQLQEDAWWSDSCPNCKPAVGHDKQQQQQSQQQSQPNPSAAVVWLARVMSACQQVLEASPQTRYTLGVALHVLRVLWVLLLVEAVLHSSLRLMLLSVGAVAATYILQRLLQLLLQPRLRASLTDATELQRQLRLLWGCVSRPLPQPHSKWLLTFDQPELEQQYKQVLAESRVRFDTLVSAALKGLVSVLPLLVRCAKCHSLILQLLAAPARQWTLPTPHLLVAAVAAGLPFLTALFSPCSYHSRRDGVLGVAQALLLAMLCKPLRAVSHTASVTSAAAAAAAVAAPASGAWDGVIAHCFQGCIAALLLLLFRQRMCWAVRQAVGTASVGLLLFGWQLWTGDFEQMPGLGTCLWALLHLLLPVLVLPLLYLAEMVDRQLALTSLLLQKPAHRPHLKEA